MTDIDNFDKQFELWEQPEIGRPQQVKISRGEKLTSLFGLGPIPATKIPATQALIAENARLRTCPGPGELTLGEQAVRARTVRKAENAQAKSIKAEAVPLIARVRSLFAQINLIDDLIIETGHRSLYGPNGEVLHFDEARDQHNTIRDQVTREISEGSKKHLLDRQTSKKRDLMLLGIDFPVFLLAMMGVLNVDPRMVVSGDIASIVMGMTAFAFAVLGTVLFGVVMRRMGLRHRKFKGAETEVEAGSAVRKRLLAEQIVLAVTVSLVALVMGTRIYTEAWEAGGSAALVVVLSGLMAVLVAVGGYLNYMAEYENGSDLTDRVRHLAAQIDGHESNLQQLRKQRSVLVEESGVTLANLRRTLAATTEATVRTVTRSSADKAIAVARSYCGSRTPVPAPVFNSPTITEIEEQTRELTAHHAMLKNTNSKEN